MAHSGFLNFGTFSLVVVFAAYISTASEIENKVCSTPGTIEECQQLSRSGQLTCQESYHDIDCVLNINNSIAHLGVLTAEEALVAARLTNDDVVVIGKIFRDNVPPYSTVVVVKSDANVDYTTLKTKKFKYCHPGFKHDALISKYILEEFENQLINKTEHCDKDVTLLERHISLIADIFGDSCRPGPWTPDTKLDAELKKKYPSLCALCGNAGCNIDYKSPMNDSINCLLNNDADIAVTTLKHAEILGRIQPGKYKLLDRIGQTTSLNDASSIWTQQLNDLIVAHETKAIELQALLTRYFPSQGVNVPAEDRKMRNLLMKIMKINADDTVDHIEPKDSLHTYVIANRAVPLLEEEKTCNVSMGWCTRSRAEQEKCRWLSQASLNQGVRPVLECHLTEDHDLGEGFAGDLSCLHDVKVELADLVTIRTDNAYAAAKLDLKSISYPETDTRRVYNIQIVLSDDSTARNVRDLKGKRACIPEFGGKEMFAFASHVKDKNLVKANPDFGKVIKNFLGDSCLPGTKSFEHTNIEDDDRDKLCRNCRPKFNNMTANYCNADKLNAYYGNKGALRCLREKRGDFAVITTTELAEDTLKIPGKVLCKNDTVRAVNNLNVDEGCALTVIAKSEMVSRSLDLHNDDYILALRDYEQLFGENDEKPFHLFNTFNGTKDLLFRDSTPGLDFNVRHDYIENLKKLIASINTSGTSGTSMILSTFSVVLVPMFYLILFK